MGTGALKCEKCGAFDPHGVGNRGCLALLIAFMVFVAVVFLLVWNAGR